jgi:hypothetical protein
MNKAAQFSERPEAENSFTNNRNFSLLGFEAHLIDEGMRMVRLWLLFIVLLMNMEAVEAAKCKVGDKWYDYNHPLCSGEQPKKKGANSSSSRSISTSVSIKSKAEYSSDSQRICKDKWTKRGELDSRMFDYCMKQKAEAYEQLRSLQKYSNQRFYSEVAFPYCNSEWTKRGVTDTRMLVYCLENEIEGIKDVEYFRKQYGDDKVNRIVAEALSRYGSWRMVAYSLRKELKDQ